MKNNESNRKAVKGYWARQREAGYKAVTVRVPEDKVEVIKAAALRLREDYEDSPQRLAALTAPQISPEVASPAPSPEVVPEWLM